MKKRAIIIIGAGAAGLAAANELSETYDVTILEALDRIGGRIHTIEEPMSGHIVEAGAEFIHGHLPITMDLVEKAGLTINQVEGKMYSVSDCDWQEEDQLIEGWTELLDKMNLCAEDMTLDAFLEMYYPHPEQEELRRHTRAYAAGFDLADPVKVSIKSLYREWTNEDHEQFRIDGGYRKLVNYLYDQCISKGSQIITHKKVSRITWKKGRVNVTTTDGQTYEGAKVIVTIPAGIMKKTAAKSAIAFEPLLDQHIDAFRKIGFGSVLKVILRFYEPFWKSKDDAGFIFSDEMIPTWWTQLPDESPVLTGWLGGPAAVQWSGIDNETILDHAISSLSAIFKMPADDLREKLLLSHHIVNWHTIDTACGAYSYETPLSAEAREFLLKPVEETIYFAGEALYNGPFPGTVEAALTTGIDAAKAIHEEAIFQEAPVQKIPV